MTTKKIFFINFLFISLNIVSADKTFHESFIKSCDFSPQGRYARGYPPYLAHKAEDSLKELEKAVLDSGIHINERMLVSGYEQNAVPSYKFELVSTKINDEASVKTSGGWSFAPGNLFGFITGFLFKDSNKLAQKSKIVEHINPESVEVFEDNTEIFQQNAFGGIYKDLTEFKKFNERYIQSSEPQKVLKVLIEFWKWIYSGDKKGAQGGLIATQDILFSILYGKYLSSSPINISKFFVGPDITYPIRVLPAQPVEATRNSQKFVSRFVDELVKRNDKKTGYIFCSFVDGVGKSTLMGNLINWKTYKSDFKSYESVNNSSSQLATLYEFKDDVFIVDLPAQMSHFCAKPDGHVFVDIKACKLENEFKKKLFTFLQQNYKSIYVKFNQELLNLQNSEIKDDNTFYEKYVKNVSNLGVELNWIPFEFEGNTFVYNAIDPSNIRMIVSFDEAHSSGLKVKEPELMIFDGATIPMTYSVFLEDLVTQMKDAGIEEVVFVDFISMYPRSSRENIRINFMLQQLRQIFKDDFILEKSLYRNFAHNHEILPLLKNYKDDVIDSIVLETLARAAMNDAILFETSSAVRKMTFEELIVFMNDRVKAIDFSERKKMFNLIKARIDLTLSDIKGLKFSKIVESSWNFNLDKIAELSNEIKNIIINDLGNEALKNEWSGLDEIEKIDPFTQKVDFYGGAKGIILAQLDSNVHDPKILGEVFNALRVSNNYTLTYVLNSQIIVPALILKKHEDSYYLIQKSNKNYIPLSKYNSINSTKKDFLFGYDPDDRINGIVLALLEEQEKYEKNHEDKNDYFVSTSKLCSIMDKFKNDIFDLWEILLDSITRPISPSDVYSDKNKLKLIVRALATQEMLLKTNKMDIMCRYANEKDFLATIRLFETVTLPAYFGVNNKTSIFAGETVKPIVQIDWNKNK